MFTACNKTFVDRKVHKRVKLTRKDNNLVMTKCIKKNPSQLLVVVVAVIAVVAVGIIIVVLVFFYYHF